MIWVTRPWGRLFASLVGLIGLRGINIDQLKHITLGLGAVSWAACVAIS